MCGPTPTRLMIHGLQGEKREEERRGAAAAKVASQQRRVRQLRPRLIRPCGGGRERDVDGRKKKTLQRTRFHRLHCGCVKIENGNGLVGEGALDMLTCSENCRGNDRDHYKKSSSPFEGRKILLIIACAACVMKEMR